MSNDELGGGQGAQSVANVPLAGDIQRAGDLVEYQDLEWGSVGDTAEQGQGSTRAGSATLTARCARHFGFVKATT